MKSSRVSLCDEKWWELYYSDEINIITVFNICGFKQCSWVIVWGQRRYLWCIKKQKVSAATETTTRKRVSIRGLSKNHIMSSAATSRKSKNTIVIDRWLVLVYSVVYIFATGLKCCHNGLQVMTERIRESLDLTSFEVIYCRRNFHVTIQGQLQYALLLLTQ